MLMNACSLRQTAQSYRDGNLKTYIVTIFLILTVGLIPSNRLAADDGNQSQFGAAAQQGLTSLLGNLDDLGRDIQGIRDAHALMAKTINTDTPEALTAGLDFELKLLGQAINTNNMVGALITEAKGKLGADGQASLAESLIKMGQVADSLKQLDIAIKSRTSQRESLEQQLKGMAAGLQMSGGDAQSLANNIANLYPTHLDGVMMQQELVLSSAITILHTIDNGK